MLQIRPIEAQTWETQSHFLVLRETPVYNEDLQQQTMALPDDPVSNPAMLKHLDAQNSPKERRLSSNECSQKWVVELCWGRNICAEKNRVSTQNKSV